MGTTAEKLTYLNETKQLLKDSINSLGGNITSQTTFRQYATELDSIYSSLPKVSGTGSILSLTPTLKGRLGSVLKGNTLQDGTPTPDSPVDIQSATGRQEISVCGKNLFDKNKITSGYEISNGEIFANANWFVSDYIPVKYGETYVKNYSSGNDCIIYDKNKTKISDNNTRFSSNKITISLQNAKYIRINQTLSNLDTYQLEVGTEATEYEPYQSQTKELNLGKNLFDKDSNIVRGKVLNDNNVITTSSTGFYQSSYVNVKSNTQYIGSNCDWLKILFYDDNYTFISMVTLRLGTPQFTTPANAKYIRISGSISLSLENNLQIEEGSQATSYSQYFTPIKLNKIGNYQDYITGTPNNWSIKRQIGEKILNGTESYSDVSVRTNTIRCLYSLQGVNYTAKMTDLSFNNGIYNQDKVGQLLENNYLVLSYPIEVVGNTTNSLKTWLSNNNSLIIYRLLEETTEPITNTELISQLNALYYAKSYNGTTNISVEGDLPMILDVSAIKGDE